MTFTITYVERREGKEHWTWKEQHEGTLESARVHARGEIHRQVMSYRGAGISYYSHTIKTNIDGALDWLGAVGLIGDLELVLALLDQADVPVGVQDKIEGLLK